MIRSLFSGVAGLKTNQTRMDVVGNNISNINTVGFKYSRATFSDILSQTSKGASSPNSQLGGINPLQVGLGTAIASIDLVTNDGAPQSTGKNTDVALSGSGMFVLKKGSSFYYSRDGAFEFDSNGNYVLPGSGLYVQGWNAVEGSLNTNASPTNIVVPVGKTMTASATTSIDFSGNLNAGAPTIKSISYTSGGVGTDSSLVINSYSITAMTYSFEVPNYIITSANMSDFPDGVGLGSAVEAKITIDGTTDTLDGSVSALKLSLTGYGEISIATTDTTLYAVAGSSVGVTTYTVDGVEYSIAQINATVSINDLEATEDDIIKVGSYATYKGVGLIGTKTTTATLSLDDAVNGISKTETISSGSGDALTIGGSYGVESVNVDGENVIAAVLTLSDGSTQKVTSGFYEVGHSIPISTVVNVYDSEGQTHAVTMLIDKDTVSTDKNANSSALNLGTDNRWRIYLAPAVGTKNPATTFEQRESDGSVTNGYFNQSENNSEGAVSYIYFDNDGFFNSAATQGGSLLLKFSNGNGADDTISAVNFTGLTQYAGNSTAYPSTDGNTFGNLQSISIDSAGILTGIYTNGVQQFEAQLAVAQFTNISGLTKVGTSLFQESNNSGAANIQTGTDLGVTITSSALEMSNVDLASEFADMITTHRGFQSNSKMITTGDEMLETLINVKR